MSNNKALRHLRGVILSDTTNENEEEREANENKEEKTQTALNIKYIKC